MIKLFSLKQQKKEEESAGGTKGTSKKASAAQLRIQKDINELNLPKTCEIDFSDQDDLLHFRLLICPDEGFYKGGKFVFSFKVKCETMVYHPNIDLEGNVCLNILRSRTPRTPLNKEAAEVLQSNRRLFEQNVQRSLRGGVRGGHLFRALPQVTPPPPHPQQRGHPPWGSPPLGTHPPGDPPRGHPSPPPPPIYCPPGGGGGGPSPSFCCPPPPLFP
ncbi:hypothetical protein Q9233_014890, partial [Columba guinea]